MNLIIGSNVEYNKNEELIGSVNEAISYNANTFMFYTGANQSAYRVGIDPEKTKEAHKLMDDNGIKKSDVIVHAPFIINLANDSDPRKWHFYVDFLSKELSRCETLGFDKLVLHPGSSVGVERSHALSMISKGLDKALESHPHTYILLEYMAGKGTECGISIDELKTIIDACVLKKQIFVCLDTCHMNDSGVDISSFDSFLDEFDEKIGIDKIKCIHINDSMNGIGSHKDRHANIGYGTIGFDNLINVIYNTRIQGVPLLLETPYLKRGTKEEYAPYKEEIEMIRNKKFIDFKKEAN